MMQVVKRWVTLGVYILPSRHIKFSENNPLNKKTFSANFFTGLKCVTSYYILGRIL
jgi:hypothetical protein